jgi:hypothetical protein
VDDNLDLILRGRPFAAMDVPGAEEQSGAADDGGQHGLHEVMVANRAELRTQGK